ncbi:MAG: tRNA (adenosine(37)-N6)-dimethylallyltransferase MiaA [Ruegeria sp.]
MAKNAVGRMLSLLPRIPDGLPVLIAGPTASGKSALALEIAERTGGIVVNADASQVYDCWRIISARPSVKEESQAPHALYGHVAFDQTYSAGHWLRDVTPYLSGKQRPIIVGGTGLYFTSLTEGMANIPATPPKVRETADNRTLQELLAELSPSTLQGIDTQNRARVQRAWEVEQSTGRSLADWHSETPPPLLPLVSAYPIIVDADRDWLLQRINARFDQMLASGAIEEVEAMREKYDPALPACKAIGVPEIMAYIKGEISLADAREKATIATRQFAKRQRTWCRSRTKDWYRFDPSAVTIG